MCLPILEQCHLESGEHMGFEFEIVHNLQGERCGYVRVLQGHPWFEKDFRRLQGVRAHGGYGLNFSDYGKSCPTHEGKDEWWVGFDCGHFGDARDPELPVHPMFQLPSEIEARLSAIKNELPEFMRPVVRTQEYVRAVCFGLAEQAADAQKKRSLRHA